MPNRILKESICTSDNIDGLLPYEEIFFYRLIVNCDDYGIMDARTSILRAKCFPLKTDSIKESDIEDWLISLIDAGLIFVYEIEGRRYLKMTSWEKHQQIRAHRSKFPMPDSGGYHLKSDDIKSPRNPIQSESESESESESNPREIVSDDAPSGAKSRPEKVPFDAIIDAYNANCISLPKVQSKSNPRKTAMRSLWKRAPDLGQVTDIFKRAESSDFLTGRDGKWVKGCGFDWLLKPSNLTKLIEGNYDNKEPPAGSRQKSDFFSGINEWAEREGITNDQG